MSSQGSRPLRRRIFVVLSLTAMVLAGALLGAGAASAARYKTVLCADNNGSNAYGTATNEPGLFEVQDLCTGAGGDPPGDAAYLRINETGASGYAPEGAYASVSWTAPTLASFLTAGAYTREHYAFNEGWRVRFWGEGSDGSKTDLLVQDRDSPSGGTHEAPSYEFRPQFGARYIYGNYRRIVFELVCSRAGGCDESGYNAVEANDFVSILSDEQDSQATFIEPSSPLLRGDWIGGSQSVGMSATDQGSGLRWERMRVDGAQVWAVDHGFECNTAKSFLNGEWARVFQPCQAGAFWSHSVQLDTAGLVDGVHTLAVCAQDFGQFQGLDETGGETCEQRTVHIDNTPPGPPANLRVVSPNTARYLDHFGARWSYTPDEGSPVSFIYYEIVNASGDVVVPMEGVLAAEHGGLNSTELGDIIRAPEEPGDYTLKLWLGDSAGEGSVATAPIPHDTVPPGAPQLVSVTSPNTPRSQDGFDVRWHNIVDAGSPIDEVHYQILNGAGAVVVPTKTLTGNDIESIQNLEAPNDRGKFSLRIWLSDEEGNAGAAATVPLSYECVRSPVGGGQQLTANLGDASQKTVKQGEGATVTGDLRGTGGDIGGAPLCIFSNPVTDTKRDFLGMAVTGSHGDYRFAIPQGPSRKITVIYRPDQRQLSASAILLTIVHPTFWARKRVVENKHFAHFEGDIPGPHNNQVVIVLQVRSGKGWLAFRRYRTRNDGHYELAYKFNRTTSPTTYEMRAQVRQTTGYPYEQGNSDPLLLKVVPDTGKNPEPTPKKYRCPRGKRVVKRVVKRGHKKKTKVVCVSKRRKHHKQHRGSASH